MKIIRVDRANDQLRDVKFTRNYTKYAEGSVLVEFGNTKVLCTASVEELVPNFLKGTGSGWVSAEYSMLPRATHTRTKRDAVTGRVNSRASEISRLIGRSLRSSIDLSILGERQILIDCDVIQADGGTRTASITGSTIALFDAIKYLIDQQKIKANPIKHQIAAISVGMYNGDLLLDLDYVEDSSADLDMNLVMNDKLEIIEIQGTAEGATIARSQLNQLIDLAELGIRQLLEKQSKFIVDIIKT